MHSKVSVVSLCSLANPKSLALRIINIQKKHMLISIFEFGFARRHNVLSHPVLFDCISTGNPDFVFV